MEEFEAFLADIGPLPEDKRPYSYDAQRIEEVFTDFHALEAFDRDNKVSLKHPDYPSENTGLTIEVRNCYLSSELIEFVKSIQHADYITIASGDNEEFVILLAYQRVFKFQS